MSWDDAAVSASQVETAVIATVIESAEAFEQAAQVLNSEDFAGDVTRCLWDAVSAMRERGLTVDPVTLAAVLDRRDRWTAFGIENTADYLVTFDYPRTHSLSTYLDLMRGQSATRSLLRLSHHVSEIAHSDASADEKFAQAHESLTPLTAGIGTGFISASDALMAMTEDMQHRFDLGDELVGYDTGFAAINMITSGFDQQDMIVLAARPSMGKTALAMNICAHMAKSGPVQVFTLEMSAKSLMQRLTAAYTGIDLNRIRNAKIEEQEWPLIASAISQLKQLDMEIDESGGLSVDQLRMRARIAARKNPPRLIMIDYLTMLSGKGENRTNEVSYISKQIKAMAKELNCPVLVLAQLNRGLESRPDKRPMMADLRESGQIEQDADVIMFNYLDEKYDEDSPRAGILELIFRKVRNGEPRTVFLDWEGQYQQFTDRKGPVPELSQKKSNKPLAAVVNGTSSREAY